MTPAYLALGSNIGDRLANLQKTAQLLSHSEGITIEAYSGIYETQSVEGGGPDDFLNAALRISTSLSARELLQAIQEIETKIGRPQPPRHGPRLIDIDILIFGEEEIDEPNLQVPHPRMHYRAFVLRPLLDVLEGGWAQETNLSWK